MPSIPYEPWELQSYDKSCSLADKSWLLFLFSERPKEVPQRLMTSLNMKLSPITGQANSCFCKWPSKWGF